MTKREARKKHRELWQWLADNPRAQKWGWPGFLARQEDVINQCYACEIAKFPGRYVDDESDDISFRKEVIKACAKCPCDWGTKQPKKLAPNDSAALCEKTGSPYIEWKDACSDEQRTEAALKVKKAWK
jgi:hypothetical protein